MARPRLPICVPPRDFHQKCQRMWPSSASIAHALSGADTYRMPFTCRTDPARRGDPLVDPGMLIGSSATPAVMVGGGGGPKKPPSAAPAPAVRRLTHASVRLWTLL